MKSKLRIEIAEQASGMLEAKFFYNDYQVYSTFAFGMPLMLERLYVTAALLERFPMSIKGRMEIESHLIGRKVYWRELPAIVQDFDGYTGKVMLRPQPPSKMFPSEPWDRELGAGHTMANGWVREDLLSPKVHWFREAADVEDSKSSAVDADREPTAAKA